MSTIVNKIREILQSEYSVQNYVSLMTEILDDLRIIAPNYANRNYPNNFAAYINFFSHIGTYNTPDKKKIIVMAVELKKLTYVENSRSAQRSLAKWMIDNNNADAALIAFYTEGESMWRLSFVRLDYEIKIENGKLKTAENMTPARRYSFLVGKDEPCHTAIERFRDYLESRSTYPSLDDLENAFSVEAVTKEFFDLYCDKYIELRNYLERNEDFVTEAKLHNYTSTQYAKKLMGQIVFLYFLQKKGWLGVKAWPKTLTASEYKNAFFARGAKSREMIPQLYSQVDDNTYRLSSTMVRNLSEEDQVFFSKCVKGEAWGSGPHNFMRKLFEEAERQGANFFDDYLEPLFYDALNVNRSEQGFYDPTLHCRIPFLSGGLFEPIDKNWKYNKFSIPNSLFSNQSSNKRDANGILDIFDRYNFTMSEDEPMEREVAIDPEMLGKVFENLLDITDRKNKGAFYTPREIVHYMCQESLINYLTNAMGVKEIAIRDFILYGDMMKDEDANVLNRAQYQGDSYDLWISEELYCLDENGNIVVDRMAEMDKALQDVRIADPAVGSGAFPLGMLNEIVRARQNITTYMGLTLKIREPIMGKSILMSLYQNDRAARRLKYETIRNCIFAADIEPSAVDIAQLRLWLSLVIDDEINPNAKSELEGSPNPRPLPNLECNILCGNSLIDEFEGMKLINESDIIGTAGNVMQFNIFQNAFDTLLDKLITKQEELFRCDNTEKKYQILQDIDALRDAVIMSQLKTTASTVQIERYQATKDMVSKPFILWQLDFAKVFREKGGFDIVIGNPPYVDSETMTKIMPSEREYYTHRYRSAKGNWDLFVLFIEKGIQLMSKNGFHTFIVPNKLISAPYSKSIKTMMSECTIYEIRDYSSVTVFKTAAVYPVVFRLGKEKKDQSVTMDVMDEMLKIRIHNSVSNDSFYADIDWDKYFGSDANALKLIEKIQNHPALTTLATVNGAATVNEAYLVKEFIYDDPEFNPSLKKFMNTGTLDPYRSYYGREYTRYLKGKYLFPVVKRVDLEAMSTKRLLESDKEKIIIGGMTKTLECYYDKGEYLAGKSTTIVYNNPHMKYIAAVLNSKLMTFYYSRFYNSMSLAGGFYRIGAPQIKQLPIAIPNDDQLISYVEELVVKVQQQLSMDCIDENGVGRIMDEINSVIYMVYDLSDDEIEIIENATTT